MRGEFIRKLLSLRVAVWLLVALIICIACGAIVMPARPLTYGTINDGLLFDWLEASGRGADNLWFWGALIALSLLTIHTIACSIDACLRIVRQGGQPILRLAPHLMHLGFVLILFGHLLSAGWGFRYGAVYPQGAYGRLPDGSTLLLRSVDMQMDANRFPRDWWADVTLFQEGQVAAEGRLGANRPLFHRGVGVYLKTLTMGRSGLAAEIMVNRDPGALWVLAGALVFTLGNTFLLLLKIRREAVA